MDWMSFTAGAFLSCVVMVCATSLALAYVLQRQFLLWVAARAVGIGLLALTFPPLGRELIAHGESFLIARTVATDVAIAALGPLLATYLERSVRTPGLDRLLWSLLPGGLILAMLAPLMAGTGAAGRFHDVLTLGLVGMLVAGVAIALRRGSRPARFQAVAWVPSILAGGTAFYYKLLLLQPMPYFAQVMLAAFMIEFVVTAAGIGDGFTVLRGQRDSAMKHMREATRANALDPLTGIANRRGLDRGFAQGSLRPRGVAVLDCDHFKRINDNFGHDVGDEVLVAVAAAIQGENIFAARMGGEEFVLLLYGENWQQDAENARRRIAETVARRVPELPFPLTASAGLSPVEPDDSLHSAIKRADRGLYAAKDAGRDRSISLTEFHRRLTRLEEIA